jgi:hypothetical protein
MESNSGVTNFVSTATNSDENTLKASHRINYPVLKAVKVNFIAETLIGLCVKDVHLTSCSQIPLAHNSGSHRIKVESSRITA